MGFSEKDAKDHKKIMKTYIPLNGSNVSDIILYDPSQHNCYKNIRTKESSDRLDKVRVNKNFLISYDWKFKPIIEGFLLHYDKERDVLFLIVARMNCNSDDVKWIEKKRSYFTRDGIAHDMAASIMEIDRNTIDICGQSIFDESNPTRGIMDLPVGSKKAAAEFWGKFIFCYDKTHPGSSSKLYTINTKRGIKELLCAEFEWSLPEIVYCTQRVSDKIFCINDAETEKIKPEARFRQTVAMDKILSFTDAKIEIPEAAMELMKKEVEKWFQGEFGIDNYNYSPQERCETSFIQKIGNRAVHRIFFADISLAYPLSETKLELIEVERLYYDENIADVDMLYCCRTAPVWVDPDLKGTVLEYNQEMIRYAVEQTVHYCIEYEEVYGRGIYKLNECFNKEYPYSIDLAAFVTAVINTNPVLEKLINAKDCPNSFKSRIYECACQYQGNENALYLGKIDKTQKELHKMLCMPKGMFEYLIETEMLDYIENFKEIFQTGEEQRYFVSMNEANWKHLVDSIAKVKRPIKALKAIALLVEIRGVAI